jgi:hypothetical protein
MPESQTQTDTNNNNNRTRGGSFTDKEVGCAFTLGQQRCCMPEWLCWWNKEDRPTHVYRSYTNSSSDNHHHHHYHSSNFTDDIPRLISVNNQRLI